jgi:hypothetical protein
MVSLLHDLVCDPNYYGVSIDQSIAPVEHFIVGQDVTEVDDTRLKHDIYCTTRIR